ncbi:MAG: double-stranded DNA-binding protein [Nitrosopumilus sp. H8]|nr:MAG: double-stranded DNA-binding protein [Nitrosopumilus sp. H8]
MQKNLSQKEEPERADPRDALLSRLGFRGEEVLRNAEAQFPDQTRMIVSKLAELIASGELPDVIDGGKLLALFRTVGLNVRMDTKINVEQDGKLVSLGEKLKSGEKK